MELLIKLQLSQTSRVNFIYATIRKLCPFKPHRLNNNVNVFAGLQKRYHEVASTMNFSAGIIYTCILEIISTVFLFTFAPSIFIASVQPFSSHPSISLIWQYT